MPQSESSEKQRVLDQYLDQILRPSLERMKEEDRVTDSLYDAAAKQDRAEFQRLWQKHKVPLARQKEADSQQPASSTPTTSETSRS